ncbi:hypothetical protein FXO37_02337 [Capsicum annuum]|nr:hypothetical protein FXO37_02337 [Capsicum annuum]
MAVLYAGALPISVNVLSSCNSRAAKEYCVSLLLALCINGGADAVPVLVKNSSLKGPLYSLLAEGNSKASKKASTLIRILHEYNEKTYSGLVSPVFIEDQFINVCSSQPSSLIKTEDTTLKRLGRLLLWIGVGRTMAATNLDVTFDRITDYIEEIKWHVERLHQLLPKIIPQNPTSLVQTPCDESFSKEEVGYPDPHQGEEEIETSLVRDSELIESEALASSKSVRDIDHALFRFNDLFENDINTPNKPSGENNGIAYLEGYSRYANPVWCDNIPPKDRNLFLKDESTLIGKECVVSEMSTLGVHDDQFTLKCISLLEHVNSVLKNSQVSDDVYRINLDNAHDSLNILCGKSIAVSFVHRDYVYANIFVCKCGSDILGEGRDSLGLGPRLNFSFDPGTLLKCRNLYAPHLMLGQDDKQCLVVGANEGRQSSSLSLFVDDDRFLCVFFTKLFMFNTKDLWIYSKFVPPSEWNVMCVFC